MEDLENNEAQTCSDFTSFLEYSAIYWPDHVGSMSSIAEREMNDLPHQIYNTTAERFSPWFPIFWKAMMRGTRMPTMNAMHLAALNGHEQVFLRLLIEGEINVNVADTTGSFPLTWASLNGHHDVLQLMVEHGADVISKGRHYGNALQEACSKGRDKVVQMLLECGADVNAQGGFLGNALNVACFKGHDKIGKMLLENGADVNAQDGDRLNALRVASYNGHDKILQMLLEHGADFNARGEDHLNALLVACSGGRGKIVQMLLKHGADVNARGGRYGNALKVACSEGHDKAVHMLQEVNSIAQSASNHFPSKRLKDFMRSLN